MHQFELTEDQLQIQEMARKFTADAITPNAAEWDEKHIFPRDTIREAAELGFGAIYVSEESGRHWPRPARGRADHGGDGLRLPVDQRFHLDPQYGALDDRPLRLGRGEAEVPTVDDHDGTDRQLLPDRAILRLRRGGIEDQSGPRRRPLCRLRDPRPSSPAAARTKSTSRWPGPGEEGPRGSPRWSCAALWWGEPLVVLDIPFAVRDARRGTLRRRAGGDGARRRAAPPRLRRPGMTPARLSRDTGAAGARTAEKRRRADHIVQTGLSRFHAQRAIRAIVKGCRPTP